MGNKNCCGPINNEEKSEVNFKEKTIIQENRADSFK